MRRHKLSFPYHSSASFLVGAVILAWFEQITFGLRN
jgi:hypothetical protein